jgi:hypothetical protein
MELMAVVDSFNGSNSVASGLRIRDEPPVFAEPKGPVAQRAGVRKPAPASPVRGGRRRHTTADHARDGAANTVS